MAEDAQFGSLLFFCSLYKPIPLGAFFELMVH